MKGNPQPFGGKGGENLLAFAQGVTEQHRGSAAVQHAPAPGNHLRNHLAGVGKAIVWLAEGALQYQNVGGNCLGRRAGEAAAGFEISGIEDTTEIGLNQRLRRPEDVAGRQEGQAASLKRDRLTIWNALNRAQGWPPVGNQSLGGGCGVGAWM